jgi:hypothetical protein
MLLSFCLTRKWYQLRIFYTAITSNLASGLIGFFLSIMLNGGWWLVVWFPWVSRHEVNVHSKSQLASLVFFYIGAFLLSIVIEGAINFLMLRRSFSTKRIIIATTIVNAASYLIGSLVLYSYSFHY